jgi:SAM-dependent methyltransferase
VVGVDLSQGMMDVARRAVVDEPGPPVTFHRADATRLPYREEFDLVVSFGAFGHVLERDEPALVASVWEALRPGGRFVFVTGERPGALSPGVLKARAFNAVMRVRNAVWRPPFVMYYLTFLLPRATELLRQRGFEVQVERWLFGAPFERHALVLATKP